MHRLAPVSAGMTFCFTEGAFFLHVIPAQAGIQPFIRHCGRRNFDESALPSAQAAATQFCSAAMHGKTMAPAREWQQAGTPERRQRVPASARLNERRRLEEELLVRYVRCRLPDCAAERGRMNTIYDDERFFAEYHAMPRSQQGLEGAGEWHQLKKLFPDLNHKRVLDLGCGYGWHCRYAVECGADLVLGIDASEKMIREARKKNSHPKIHYEVCGLEEYQYPEHAFDCVLSNLVLHYVENLEGIYQKVFRTLTEKGIFLFNIEHPVFTGSVRQEWIRDSEGKPQYWPVDRYFYPGQRETTFLGQKVLKQHHTLTQILMGLLTAGFRIEAVEEAVPPPGMMGLPGMAEEWRRPMMLMVRSTKDGELKN